MLKLTSTQGSPIYVNPHTIVAVTKFGEGNHTSILTSSGKPDGSVLVVKEHPEIVVAQWEGFINQIGTTN